MAELEQLTLDSLVSPAGILPGHALDQHGHSVLDGWTPAAVWIRPFLGDQVMVPTQDRDSDGAISHEEFRTAICEFYLSDDENAPGNWLIGPFGRPS